MPFPWCHVSGAPPRAQRYRVQQLRAAPIFTHWPAGRALPQRDDASLSQGRGRGCCHGWAGENACLLLSATAATSCHPPPPAAAIHRHQLLPSTATSCCHQLPPTSCHPPPPTPFPRAHPSPFAPPFTHRTSRLTATCHQDITGKKDIEKAQIAAAKARAASDAKGKFIPLPSIPPVATWHALLTTCLPW